MTNELTRYSPEDEDAPLVPELPRQTPIPRTDGGRGPTTTARRLAERPVDTTYAEGRTRDTEELLPLVPDLTGRYAD
ncbi:hypothetical protein [Halomarina litorea]|uniref:hypothetical protein n=1 Tax=Halomarina litorea TaxID=2961595 RepID=UPI0020C54CDB|nr:hypothetical protein [Halomarina sp. BCD28]